MISLLSYRASLFFSQAAKTFHTAFPIPLKRGDSLAARSLLQCFDDGSVLSNRSACLLGSVPVCELNPPHFCFELRQQDPQFAVVRSGDPDTVEGFIRP